MTKLSSQKKEKEMHSTPVWVKIFGIIFVILVVLFVILHLTGNSPGGGH